TFDQLIALPLSKLTPQEKEFVQYMRRNPQIFHRIASLDGKSASMSPEDVKMAAQLAGDALVLSDEDLLYLKAAPLHRPETLSEEMTQGSGPNGKLNTQDFIDT